MVGERERGRCPPAAAWDAARRRRGAPTPRRGYPLPSDARCARLRNLIPLVEVPLRVHVHRVRHGGNAWRAAVAAAGRPRRAAQREWRPRGGRARRTPKGCAPAGGSVDCRAAAQPRCSAASPARAHYLEGRAGGCLGTRRTQRRRKPEPVSERKPKAVSPHEVAETASRCGRFRASGCSGSREPDSAGSGRARPSRPCRVGR